MPKKTLSSLSSFVQDFTFTRGDVELVLSIDIDAMTDSYFHEVGKLRAAHVASRSKDVPETPVDANAEEDPAEAKRKATESITKGIIEIWDQAAESVSDKKEMRIDQLLCGEESHVGSLLRGWDAVDEEGNPVPLTATALREFSPNALEDLWNFCSEKASGVKKN